MIDVKARAARPAPIWAAGRRAKLSPAFLALVTDDADPTKKAVFELAGISTGTTRTFSLPNTTSELAILAGTQTFTGNKTFSDTLTASGTVTVSAVAATIGTATTTATYGMGTGPTTTGVTKTVNLGTGGAPGSTTVVNIGPIAAGAGGTTVVNTPTVTFANAVKRDCVAIDGSKFKADNNRDKNFTKGKIASRLAHLADDVERYIADWCA